MSIARSATRLVTALALLAAGALALSGCVMDQGTEGSVGVTVVGDHAIALVCNCAGYSTSSVELNDGRDGLFSSNEPMWESKSMMSGAIDLGSLAKFEQLIPNGSYAPLYVQPHGGAVRLTRAKVVTLSPGQVLTMSLKSLKTVRVSRAYFEGMARQTCASQSTR